MSRPVIHIEVLPLQPLSLSNPVLLIELKAATFRGGKHWGEPAQLDLHDGNGSPVRLFPVRHTERIEGKCSLKFCVDLIPHDLLFRIDLSSPDADIQIRSHYSEILVSDHTIVYILNAGDRHIRSMAVVDALGGRWSSLDAYHAWKNEMPTEERVLKSIPSASLREDVGRPSASLREDVVKPSVSLPPIAKVVTSPPKRTLAQAAKEASDRLDRLREACVDWIRVDLIAALDRMDSSHLRVEVTFPMEPWSRGSTLDPLLDEIRTNPKIATEIKPEKEVWRVTLAYQP